MIKNRLAKVETLDEQIAKLQEQRKQELQKHRQEERKEQDKRRRTRGEVIEKLMPDTINLTIEEFTTFINKTTANTFGRDKLAEIIRGSEAKTKPQEAPSQNEKAPPPSSPQQPNEKSTTQPPLQPSESKN